MALRKYSQKPCFRFGSVVSLILLYKHLCPYIPIMFYLTYFMPLAHFYFSMCVKDIVQGDLPWSSSAGVRALARSFSCGYGWDLWFKSDRILQRGWDASSPSISSHSQITYKATLLISPTDFHDSWALGKVDLWKQKYLWNLGFFILFHSTVNALETLTDLGCIESKIYFFFSPFSSILHV